MYNQPREVVFISGSTHGIGKGIAQHFLSRNDIVIINGRGTKPAWMDQQDGKLYYYRADFEDINAIRDLSYKLGDDFPDIDYLVCNVGSGKSVSPGKENYQEWQNVLSKNFFSAVNGVFYLKPLLRKGIVCISSICGQNVIEGAPITYSVAKSAINHWIKTLARPLYKKHGLTINAVAPGNILFDTSVWATKIKTSPKEIEEMLYKDVAMNRFGCLEDVANMVTFLCSEKASFITGQIFTVDGGQIR